MGHALAIPCRACSLKAAVEETKPSHAQTGSSAGHVRVARLTYSMSRRWHPVCLQSVHQGWQAATGPNAVNLAAFEAAHTCLADSCACFWAGFAADILFSTMSQHGSHVSWHGPRGWAAYGIGRPGEDAQAVGGLLGACVGWGGCRQGSVRPLLGF